jgi:quercetin dioxygenase-like cupin family protein
MPKGKGWTALTPDEQQWAGPSWRPEEKVRQIVELPLVTQMAGVRGHLWKYPPGGQGRKHLHREQEEIFVVVEGTFTMTLGEEEQVVTLPPRSVVVLSPGTPIHIRNESDADAIAFMVGSPPVLGDGVILEG